MSILGGKSVRPVSRQSFRLQLGQSHWGSPSVAQQPLSRSSPRISVKTSGTPYPGGRHAGTVLVFAERFLRRALKAYAPQAAPEAARTVLLRPLQGLRPAGPLKTAPGGAGIT